MASINDLRAKVSDILDYGDDLWVASDDAGNPIDGVDVRVARSRDGYVAWVVDILGARHYAWGSNEGGLIGMADEHDTFAPPPWVMATLLGIEEV